MVVVDDNVESGHRGEEGNQRHGDHDHVQYIDKVGQTGGVALQEDNDGLEGTKAGDFGRVVVLDVVNVEDVNVRARQLDGRSHWDRLTHRWSCGRWGHRGSSEASSS